ncbi:MAG TPA: alpha/beta fold hydrolase [Micropepsaceae bacterium]|nr:alpha/beta fold hydrolase [Micropepsaceae bacterium]
MDFRSFVFGGLLFAAVPACAQDTWPNQHDAEFTIRDFHFADGEVLPELRLHYVTLGTPKRDAQGEITNGVVLLHGTSGSGQSWMLPTLAGELFGRGQPLDAGENFIIIPDSIGTGRSSKPSDGLKGKFPHYRYHDIVEAEHRLVTEALGIRHLRLVMGSSMGGMQTWMWGEMYPGLMDGLVPIASMPIQISGRNLIERLVRMNAILHDPDYHAGNYEKNPTHWIYTSPLGAMTTDNPWQIQKSAPDESASIAMYDKLVADAEKNDANNTLYGIQAVLDYDPSKDLEKINARLMAINFADDEANPPSLHVLEPAVKRIAHAQYVLIPASEKTHGHYTHLRAAIWKSHLAEFMKQLPQP